jgi:hypothetical protein
MEYAQATLTVLSLINPVTRDIRPSEGNRSRDVEDPDVRESVRRVVNALITE